MTPNIHNNVILYCDYFFQLLIMYLSYQRLELNICFSLSHPNFFLSLIFVSGAYRVLKLPETRDAYDSARKQGYVGASANVKGNNPNPNPYLPLTLHMTREG
jgi:hypothetical protein